MKNIITCLALGLGLALGLVAAPAMAQKANIIVVTHGADTDAWWTTIKNAVKAAADDTGANVQYRNAPTGEAREMVPLIESAIAQNPDGLVVSIQNPDILADPIKKAVAAGIPVVSINSGDKVSKSLGAVMHVGQPEYDAGFGGGERTKSLGGSKGICFNHEPTNTALTERCQGFADGLGDKLNMVEVPRDFGDIKNTVISRLTTDSSIDSILAVGPTGCDPTIAALQEMGKSGDIILGCFDLGPAIIDGIKEDTVHYAIDQQPWLQGYIPIVVLYLHHRNGVLPGNSINSGPGFITKDNIDLVGKLAGVER